MEVEIEQSWKEVLKDEFCLSYFKELTQLVRSRYKQTTVYPPANQIFQAFKLCSFDNVKVVILGQDPYHGPNQANGLSFSVKLNQQIPPSLQNIYKELNNDLGIVRNNSGELDRWAVQGVLLLNSILTVEASKPGSHQKIGWEQFTNDVIKIISNKKEHVVFILWGAYAQKKRDIIDKAKHLIIQSAHPSPLSAHKGFFESKPFSKANEYLKNTGQHIINW